jgi:biopolymer transport protein ExbB
VFETIGAAHQESTAITVASQEIFTASGKHETVNLLRFGHVRFAYQTIPDGRLGLTLASPQGASGYRWSENINSTTGDMLRQAFAACQSGQAGWVSVPVEPTGRLPLDEVHGGQSLSQWFIAGGSVMYPIAAVALASVVLIVERSIFFFVRNRNANRTAAEVVQACAARRFDDALALLRQKPGVVTRVLDACLKRREAGQRAMEDAIQEQLLQEQPGLRRFMSGLATLAGVAPLLGLLGTVTGIIQTFDVIRSFGNANPNLMAGGISEALITTEAGLMIAIPVLVIHSLLRGCANRILADAEYYAATLLTTLVHGGLASPATPRSTDSRRRPAMNGKPHAQPPAAPLVEAAAGSAEVGHE